MSELLSKEFFDAVAEELEFHDGWCIKPDNERQLGAHWAELFEFVDKHSIIEVIEEFHRCFIDGICTLDGMDFFESFSMIAAFGDFGKTLKDKLRVLAQYVNAFETNLDFAKCFARFVQTEDMANEDNLTYLFSYDFSSNFASGHQKKLDSEFLEDIDFKYFRVHQKKEKAPIVAFAARKKQ
eukprot:TRINITY_DN775939_c0_g1_i1.p1 TRINITY_DN775939_c0_g1~~TRINITY_DN775939_c0_g1_i1.p1  ORF type:complete len:182 (-),score=39.59 TRINITY_DN775939_c0_g1_i1:346-891(-)